MGGRRILYLDGSAGVSGDMTLGALVDVGVAFDALVAELDKLGVRGFALRRSRGRRGGLRGTRIRVDAPGDRGYRHLEDFLRVLRRSRLSASVKERAAVLLRRLFAAEARVHGRSVERIHLHELGSLDTLVDVVGTLVALELLGAPEIVASPVNVGGGSVETEHGMLAVPTPATLELLRGAPVFSDGSSFERTTPTGALLVGSLARRFGPFPAMRVERVGYGLGSRDPAEGRPNALRLVLGRAGAPDGESIAVVEATIDDMTPELAGYLLERLFEAGAVDAFLTPVTMKKSRLGIGVTALAPPAARDEVVETLLRESTSLGVRYHEAERRLVERRSESVETPWGRVRVKLGLVDGRIVNAAPEYEDCRRIAKARAVPLKEVQAAAVAALRRARPTEHGAPRRRRKKR